ncbi:MAG: DUF4372 domain-containing protein [Saprospiraceae bacterium]|nr:DUF4372 domain-containing protein [Candidatus Vicinibacter proximus]
MEELPRNLFQNLVNKHESNKHIKGIDSWTHLVSLLFCHFGQISSLRDINNGLRSITGNINPKLSLQNVSNDRQ